MFDLDLDPYVRSIHGPWLLYDNQSDPDQERNLVGKERALEARLERKLDGMLKKAGDEFLPGDRCIERAHAAHYREVVAPVGRVKSPWGDWESTWRWGCACGGTLAVSEG